jgi:hypothetical protein
VDLPQPYWVVDRLEASSLKVFDYSVFLIYFCEVISSIPSLKEKEKAKASAEDIMVMELAKTCCRPPRKKVSTRKTDFLSLSSLSSL